MIKPMILSVAFLGLLGSGCDTAEIGIPEEDKIGVCTLDWIHGCKPPEKPRGPNER